MIPGLTVSEAAAFILRIVFTLSLYAFVAVTFLVLRRQLRRASSAHATDGGDIQPPTCRLVLDACGPADGPVGRVVDLEREIVIGRRPPCDILVLDDAVSSQHAQFVPDAGSGWLVLDLGSTNGTTVNGTRIGTPARLTSGDVVGIGAMTWRFVDPSSPITGRTR